LVEVWLPYREIEIPVMLPDPINLRIMAKTVYPQGREREALERLRLLVGDKATPIYSPVADEAERSFIRRLLRRAGVEEGGDRRVYIDIYREDPILGFRSSTWIPMLSEGGVEVLRKALDGGLEPRRPRGVYVDLILDGGARLYDVLGSRDGGHLGEARERYRSGWCLRSEPGRLILASMGGEPWDSSLYLFMVGLAKLAKLMEPGQTTSLVVASIKQIDVDPTILRDLEPEGASDPRLFYIAYSKRLVRDLNIVYYGSLPRTIASLLGINKIRSPEAYIHRLPVARKRDVLVIEDLYLMSTEPCLDSYGEGEHQEAEDEAEEV